MTNFSTQSEVDPGAGFNRTCGQCVVSPEDHLQLRHAPNNSSLNERPDKWNHDRIQPHGWYLNGGDSGAVCHCQLQSVLLAAVTMAIESRVDNLTISAVPEPATWAVLAAGFGASGSTKEVRIFREAIASLNLR
jgi:hypothetical protein